MHLKPVYRLTCVLTFLAAAAAATTIVMPTDEQLIAKSPVIVEATVVSSTPVDRGNRIRTETLLSVTKTIKGSVPDQLTVREIGGAIDDRITVIFGAPQYTAGEHVLVFLTPTPRGDYQTVDLFVGKFSDEKMANGEHLWARHDEAADVALLDQNFRKLPTHNVQRRAAGFEAYIIDRVAGREGQRNYGVVNPILEPVTKYSNLTSNFTLISEPSVYRWNSFDTGTTAGWYSYGTQPGYSGGGVNEVTTAMAAWTGYSAAKILYSYIGSESSAASMDTQNGRNEVLFNDPFGDISGSWNPSTGGVVGLGGFNGVSAAKKWTSPFAADASHPQATFNAYTITEANLTIQDGVSPTAKISSTTLAEICAHEFGHTIGLGHSSDSTALMYPTVTGLGPSLRSDDQLAARWLYPSGTQQPPTPTIPAAPTNLTASVASDGTVTLRWTDNAGGNETGESVYVAPLNGSYQKVGDLAAGTTGAQLTGAAAGTYTAYVVSYNAAGTSSPSNVAQFTVSPSIPAVTAAFTFSPSAPTTEQNVTFTDQSAGATAWVWNFGDGSTSTQQNPVKRFTIAGSYNVTLTVSNGTVTSSVAHMVAVSQGVPAIPTASAAFDWTPSTPNQGGAVQFYDRSTGSPTSWSWDFGDGGTSAAQNPAHTFAGAGTYTVTLTVANSVSSSTSTRAINVAAVIVPYRSLISVSAQTDGVGGSQWRTELSLFNAGSEAANVQLIFIPAAGGTTQSRSFFLSRLQSVTYANALLDIFGLSTGAGAIAIQADSPTTNANLKVTSRTFTTGSTGTYGQGVPDVQSSDLQQALYLTGIESDASYRTNIGVVNRTGAPVLATLALFDANGNPLGSSTATIPGNNFQQASLVTWFPAVGNRSLAGMSMKVTSASNSAVSVYASVVDNRTQDPIYIQGVPQPSGAQLVIPAVGRAAGANGTFWRSDVTLYNPTTQSMSVALRFLAAGADDRNAPMQAVQISAGRTATISDVMTWLGLGDGSGALQVSWSGTAAGPIVTSRTYTTADGGGTYGQSIDPVPAYGADSFVPGLRSDASFRSNVGFVNGGDATIGVSVTLLSTFGQTIATGFVQLPPRSQMQYSLPALFPGINAAALGSFTLRAHSDAGNVFAYGSIVDNSSGDPVFFAGR